MNAVPKSTLNDYRPAAAICREKGWCAGTCLVGDEGFGPSVIRITAIGEEVMLARQISQSGKPYKGSEHSWCLDCRDWQPLPAPPSA